VFRIEAYKFCLAKKAARNDPPAAFSFLGIKIPQGAILPAAWIDSF
jgi:hypothetical protein